MHEYYCFTLEALTDPKRIANKQWTYCSSFMLKTWFYSLARLFWFFCFLIRNLIPFFLLFIAVIGLKILTTMFIPGTTLIKNGSLFHHHAYYGHRVYSGGKSNLFIPVLDQLCFSLNPIILVINLIFNDVFAYIFACPFTLLYLLPSDAKTSYSHGYSVRNIGAALP